MDTNQGRYTILDPGQQAPSRYSIVSEGDNQSTIGELGRQIGLTGRAVAGGLAQSVQPFTEPLRYALNLMLPGNPVGNLETATDEVLTKAGVPEPKDSLERGVQSVGRFATSWGAGTGIAKGAEKALGLTLPAKAIAPSTSRQLKEYGKAAYQAADDAGVVIAPNSFRNVVSSITNQVKDQGLDSTLHPRATAALKRLSESVDEPVTFKELEILRRVVKNAAASVQPDERRIASIMSSKIDDFVSGLGKPDVVAGDPEAASAAISSARNLWSRMSKSETVENLIERANTRAQQFSGSGLENALRTEFRQLAMNAKKMRGFSPAEQQAIKLVAKGGPIENALRMLGKAAPTGVVSSALSSGLGYLAGGGPGAVLLPAGGLAARQAATAMTANNAQKAAELMRRGAPVVKSMSPELPAWLLGGAATLDPLYGK